MLRKLLKDSTDQIIRSLVWTVVTRVPLVERVVQPVPGKAGWVRIAISGSTFLMPDHRWWITFVNGWEADTFRAYRALIRPGDAVVDVGAWIGPTVMFARVCRAGRILAIEPNPECRRYLDALVDAVRSTGTELVICTTGVFIASGEAEFGTPNGEIAARASASLTGRGMRIQVARLPELLAQYGFADPAFVKIDIEGAEFTIADQIGALAALPGIRVFLSLHPPLAPIDIDKRDLVAALTRFDLYDARLEPIAHESVAARVFSNERMPGWGTAFGNFFELTLAPHGEPLRRI